jgi:hypothetical protein
MQEVQIKHGFYKGYIGKIHNFKEKDGLIEYEVQIPTKKMWLKESDLKAYSKSFFKKFFE